MPKWNDIINCPIARVLGVTECNNCDTVEQCWGKEVVLPETEEGIKELKKVLGGS